MHNPPLDHSALVLQAEKWLKSQGCGIVIKDPFRATTNSGEQPDAIGWRDGLSILIECKSSRSDFLADKRKRFRKYPSLGMGDWRFYLCPKGVIISEDLPKGWGLLYATNKQITKVHNIPSNCNWYKERPFEGAKKDETRMMYSALRRIALRGHFDDIYERIGVDNE